MNCLIGPNGHGLVRWSEAEKVGTLAIRDGRTDRERQIATQWLKAVRQEMKPVVKPPAKPIVGKPTVKMTQQAVSPLIGLGRNLTKFANSITFKESA